MKVNVLVTGPSLNGISGGQVTHLRNIKKAFFNDPNYQISIFSSSNALEGQESRIGKLFWFFLKSIIYPLYLVHINVVHINTTLNNKACFRDAIYIAWSLLFKKKVILQVHGGTLNNVTLLKKTFIKKVWLYLLSKCEIILLLTDHQLNSFLDLKISQCEKINNYVQIPTNLPSGGDPYTFTFLGRVVKEKGIFELLLAINDIKNDFDFILNVFGEGEDLPEFLIKIDELNLTDKVFYKGSVSGDFKEQAYISSNAFLLPSYAEGLPYSLLEAMSYGIPVVATSVGAIPSLIENRKTGLLIKPKSIDDIKSGMVELMTNIPLNEYLATESRNYITEHHSSTAMKEKFTKLWIK